MHIRYYTDGPLAGEEARIYLKIGLNLAYSNAVLNVRRLHNYKDTSHHFFKFPYIHNNVPK